MIGTTSDSREAGSVVPPGLRCCAQLHPELRHWTGLVRRFRALWLEALLCVIVVPAAVAADHPELPQSSECLSCHAEKTKGQSVHFDFAHTCTVCHSVSVTDGTTSITLVLPKEKICYSCHEKAAMDQVAFMKGECVSCHDAHNSERLYLLRANVPVSNPGQKP